MTSKPVAVFDIDGTIFRSSLVIELTNRLISAGMFPEDARSEFEDNYREWLNRDGEYEAYIDAVVATFAKYSTGIKAVRIESISENVIHHLSRQTYRYTRRLIEVLRNTHFLIAISGSPQCVVKEFVVTYDFDEYSATNYKTDRGCYTGEIEQVVGRKDEVLQQLIDKHGLTLEGSVGVGDTESDVSFLQMVEQPIVFNPNQKLYSVAKSSGWNLVVERKDMIYKLGSTNGQYVLSETN